jgi:hypothetical protein
LSICSMIYVASAMPAGVATVRSLGK